MMVRSDTVQVLAISAALVLSTCSAFTTTPRLAFQSRNLAQQTKLSAESGSGQSLVVVSPPGGVGEVAAVKAATMGNSVRWFVVSPEANQQVVLSQEALSTIAAAGGRVDLAGADVPSLLLPEDDPSSAIRAVSAWCGQADAMVCTFDGVENARPKKPTDDGEDPQTTWKNGIKVAAKEAASAITGTKLAIMSAQEEVDSPEGGEDSGEGGLGAVVGSLFGGGRVAVPATLAKALAGDAAGAGIVALRHGQLFGIPESSPDFSPLVGGPRKEPELCEEYRMRSVRVDPTISLSGVVMAGSSTRSSRHAVGEAAAMMALGTIPVRNGLDVAITSLPGADAVDVDVWEKEFNRVEKMLSSSEGAQLFTAEFSSVPDVERLADWLNTKWAPAILRTYDIAAIRIGARPVYSRRAGEGKVEIVWQQLVDFGSVTVGNMLIEVTDTGLVAMRGPGDASKGFGAVSRKPLAGEDVLVQRLAEAAAQAVEKGLAVKATTKKEEKLEPVLSTPVTSIQSSGTVEVAASATPPPARESGPRQAGARRSTERARGKRRKRVSRPTSDSSSSQDK